jgi:hypothetical protein
MTAGFVAFLFAVQTVVTPPNNKYSPADDVKMGREAADQVERQQPIMRDDEVTSFVENIGHRLVDAIPPELRHPEFQYTFKVVNVREINAFALPGGPMFVNRGMLEAAKNEGEIAGVMAHEISHVVLRHGTAQASKQGGAAVTGATVAGAVLGAILGGGVGRAVMEGTRFSVGGFLLKFSRDFERQADLEGSHIMTRAGYDPVDMANFFRTIQEKAGSNGPEWLSDHPDPGNRYETILKEASTLPRENPYTPDAKAFEQLQAHLQKLPKAPTTAEATRSAGRSGGGGAGGAGGAPPSGNVEPPSGQSVQYGNNLFRVSVPSNWRELRGRSAVTFSPPGAFGAINGQNVFTHGVEIAIAQSRSSDLQSATDELVNGFVRGNADLKRTDDNGETKLGGKRALKTTFSNRSEATGKMETIQLYTALLRDRRLFYLIAVAPESDFPDYSSTFDRLVESIRLND